MKVKYKLSENTNYAYTITANNVELAVSLSNGSFALYGIRSMEHGECVPLSKVEGALASVRGFFAHKKNMDKLLALSDNRRTMWSLSQRASFFRDDVIRGCTTPSHVTY